VPLSSVAVWEMPISFCSVDMLNDDDETDGLVREECQQLRKRKPGIRLGPHRSNDRERAS
jgi:hypothetical protein